MNNKSFINKEFKKKEKSIIAGERFALGFASRSRFYANPFHCPYRAINRSLSVRSLCCTLPFQSHKCSIFGHRFSRSLHFFRRNFFYCFSFFRFSALRLELIKVKTTNRCLLNGGCYLLRQYATLFQFHYFGVRLQGISAYNPFALRSMVYFINPRPQASSSLPHNRVAFLVHSQARSLAVLRGCYGYFIRPQF